MAKMDRTGAVRPMRAEDLESVARLEQTCFSESWSENLLRSGLDNRLDSYLVYEELGAVLGYCVLRTLADEGEIQRIAVDPAFRRQGIARKLMESMAAVARMKGAREVALEVRESNVSARKLYESYGFRQEAVRRDYYRNPAEDAIIMWRGIRHSSLFLVIQASPLNRRENGRSLRICGKGRADGWRIEKGEGNP